MRHGHLAMEVVKSMRFRNILFIVPTRFSPGKTFRRILLGWGGKATIYKPRKLSKEEVFAVLSERQKLSGMEFFEKEALWRIASGCRGKIGAALERASSIARRCKKYPISVKRFGSWKWSNDRKEVRVE